MSARAEFFHRRENRGDRQDDLAARGVPIVEHAVDDRKVALVLDRAQLRPLDLKRDAAHTLDHGSR